MHAPPPLRRHASVYAHLSERRTVHITGKFDHYFQNKKLIFTFTIKKLIKGNAFKCRLPADSLRMTSPSLASGSSVDELYMCVAFGFENFCFEFGKLFFSIVF